MVFRTPRKRSARRQRIAFTAVAAVAALTLAIAAPSGAHHPPRTKIGAPSPNLGPGSGGTTVVIPGQNLSGATAVMFGSTPATSFTAEEGAITAVTPEHAAGKVPVRVTTPLGTSNAKKYEFLPGVTGVSPDNGWVLGGTSVTVTGFGFADGATKIYFGGEPAEVRGCPSSTTCEVETPPNRPGTFEVKAKVSGIKQTEPGAHFRYHILPRIKRLIPAEGSVSGGTAVVITGEDFTGATAVKFGSTEAVKFTVESATSITAESPAGTGTVDVTVTTAEGTSVTTTEDRFTYVP
jgi:hypothetical protein